MVVQSTVYVLKDFIKENPTKHMFLINGFKVISSVICQFLKMVNKCTVHETVVFVWGNKCVILQTYVAW